QRYPRSRCSNVPSCRSAMKNRHALAILILFLGFAWSAHWVDYFSWDLQIALWLQSWTQPAFQTIMLWVSIPGNGLLRPFVPGVVGCLALLLAGKRLEAACGAISAGGGGLISSLCKWMIARPRPSPNLVQVWTIFHGSSFP